MTTNLRNDDHDLTPEAIALVDQVRARIRPLFELNRRKFHPEDILLIIVQEANFCSTMEILQGHADH